eukprot:scaffold22207_cov56-Phaeocystis_antarctica.AAC.3
MWSTLASRGRLAMYTTARPTWLGLGFGFGLGSTWVRVRPRRGPRRPRAWSVPASRRRAAAARLVRVRVRVRVEPGVTSLSRRRAAAAHLCSTGCREIRVGKTGLVTVRVTTLVISVYDLRLATC